MNVRTKAANLDCEAHRAAQNTCRRTDRQRLIVRLAVLCLIAAPFAAPARLAAQPASDEDFYPAWAAHARYLQPLSVLDTDSALGRRNLHPKSITLKDMARMHGHLCDGLVTAWVELGAALRDLYPNGVVDRTDVRTVSKNAPCWADAGAWMTGARINQGTLVLDNSVGDGFIVQRISTGAALRVSLRPGVYPAQLAALEQSIRIRRARGESVAPAEIDRFESGANEYSRKLLNTPPGEAVTVERLADYHFPDHSQNPLAPRSDIIDRDAPRSSPPATVDPRIQP
jgi:formylmethanofuran dehydrogenase subunit E